MGKSIFLMKSIIVLFFGIIILCLDLYGIQKPAWQGKIEYENGIKIIKNPSDPLYGEIVLQLEEDLIMGNEVDELFMFFKWISIDVDRNGNIYVLDRGNYRIQKFNKNGGFIQTIGREGQGPGEFSKPTFITLDEKGNIYVKDGVKAQIFDRTGQFVRSFPIPLNSNYFKITSEGNFLGERMTIRPPDDLHEGVVLMDDRSKVLKNIANFPSIKMDSMFNRKDRFAIQVPELKFCSSLKDYAVYGYPSEYRLFVVDSKGDVKIIIEVDGPAEKISSRERNKIIDVLMDSIKSRKSSKQEPRNELEKKVLIPKTRPFFDEIRMDENGNIYTEKLKSYLSEDKSYDLDFFNDKGNYLFRLKVPSEVSNFLLIKRGYIFSAPYSQELECFQVKRYKIKNWDQIKEGK